MYLCLVSVTDCCHTSIYLHSSHHVIKSTKLSLFNFVLAGQGHILEYCTGGSASEQGSNSFFLSKYSLNEALHIVLCPTIVC